MKLTHGGGPNCHPLSAGNGRDFNNEWRSNFPGGNRVSNRQQGFVGAAAAVLLPPCGELNLVRLEYAVMMALALTE